MAKKMNFQKLLLVIFMVENTMQKRFINKAINLVKSGKIFPLFHLLLVCSKYLVENLEKFEILFFLSMCNFTIFFSIENFMKCFKVESFK